jgi:hypothetical protein
VGSIGDHQIIRVLTLQWKAYARYLASTTNPILVGPWRSEVGFECLYWVPFVQQFRHRYKIDRNRLIAIGRGGSAAWYDMAGQADLYEHVPLETARAWSIQASQQTGSVKQHRVEPWEAHVCGLTAASLGLRKYHVLSPSWMYSLLRPYWEGQTSQRWINDRLAHALTMPAPKIAPELKAKLPAEYVAMRWYARPTWPYREDLVNWTRKFVEGVAKKIPVVLIDSFHADDHADLNLGPIPNTLRLSELAEMTPLNNLAVQSSVIKQAKAYVGTYGGMAQGAMRWGVPTVALYHEFGQTAAEHLQLTQHLSLLTKVPFLMVQPKEIDGVLPLVLGRA